MGIPPWPLNEIGQAQWDALEALEGRMFLEWKRRCREAGLREPRSKFDGLDDEPVSEIDRGFYEGLATMQHTIGAISGNILSDRRA